jgi:hypothetical protein
MPNVRRHGENRSNRVLGGTNPPQLSKSITQSRYFFDSFSQEPINTKAGLLLAPGGTALQACLIHTGKHTFQWATTADETDQFYPTLATDGGYNFQIANTPVLNDGVEINFGGDVTAHPRNFTGSAENFFCRVLLNLTDASGGDVFFGLKKVAATVATLTEITDLVGIRALGDSSSTTASWTILTNLNNSGSTDYSSTSVSVTGLEDLTAVELEIQGVNGKAFIYVNGVEVTGFSYTFDTDDVLSPILRLAQTTDTTAAYKLFAVEGGLLEDRSTESLATLASATT